MASMDFYGLRTAKGLVKRLSENVKGERDSYAAGYRAALNAAVKAIEAEMAAVKAENAQ